VWRCARQPIAPSMEPELRLATDGPIREKSLVKLPFPVVVVGGHTRNIGKTRLVEGIIRELQPLGWTAVKITQFGHGVCSRDGHACQCAPRRHAFEITGEVDAHGRSDTCRFLAAGALRSLWLRVRASQLGQAMPALLQALEKSEKVIVESNSILQFIKPSVFLMVMDVSQKDFKPSAQRVLGLVDAWVTVGGKPSWDVWPEVERKHLANQAVYTASFGAKLDAKLSDFLLQRLAQSGNFETTGAHGGFKR
jgi:molybdopterin-guanine dinucleotide biosynthesis protein